MVEQLLDNEAFMKKDLLQKPIIDCTTYDLKFENYHIDTQLTLEITDVDDLALAWFIYENDLQLNYLLIQDTDIDIRDEGVVTDTYPKWLWREGAKHGSGSENITQWIHNNFDNISLNKNKFEAYLAISIYDFPYEKFFLPGGKWSFYAKLSLDGKIIWENSIFKPSEKNCFGLQYLKIFKLKKNETILKVSESVPLIIKEKIFNYIYKNYNFCELDNKTKTLNQKCKEK